MSTTTPRHHRPASARLRRTGTWTAALGLGALSAAGLTTLGAPTASSSPEMTTTSSSSPVVLTSAEPVLDPVRISCEPGADARFDDPAHPDRITNKACGYRDAGGRTHSADPWIEEQLAAVR